MSKNPIKKITRKMLLEELHTFRVAILKLSREELTTGLPTFKAIVDKCYNEKQTEILKHYS